MAMAVAAANTMPNTTASNALLWVYSPPSKKLKKRLEPDVRSGLFLFNLNRGVWQFTPEVGYAFCENFICGSVANVSFCL